jgi:hypothetical protein
MAPAGVAEDRPVVVPRLAEIDLDLLAEHELHEIREVG